MLKYRTAGESFLANMRAIAGPAAVNWIEFEVTGPVETQRYRTTPDARTVQYWSEHRVPGMARKGWNTTKSENVAMKARAYVKSLG